MKGNIMNTFELSVINQEAHVALRLITTDGGAPQGTIADIREVTGVDVETCLAKVWNWFVNRERLALVSRDGTAFPYRGGKTFIKAALAFIEHNTPKPDNMQVREFTQNEKYGFAGAAQGAMMCVIPEGGHLENPPQVAKFMTDEFDCNMVADDGSISIMWCDCNGMLITSDLDTKGIADSLEIVSKMPSNPTLGNLIDLGFSSPERA
ncbi:hypothetical protein NVP1244A_108 [Vibrio phage 1.244.A._10N.261.54.C3]|nr:hypothetical protein NVP1244A_108 [Vibrio phage 1.244.A._10N.261.54.C3]AUR98736.1 hypothetical protein NVP1255O_108 [Vibrio phage 1.255.O._10N.286.45.F1]